MHQKQTFFSLGLLESGHTFYANETLLKFQYRVLNMILLVTTIFPAMFALASLLSINPLGSIHTVVNCLYSLSCIILIVRLRGPKTRYRQSACGMYVASLLAFTSALIFVPSDEFRIILFYLLVFASYITGGVRSGDLITAASIVMILLANKFFELQLSETAIFSALLGLIIASLLIRSYTKKISDYEEERNIWMQVSRNDAGVMITVEDNGGGVGKDIIEKIFEPYFSTKSKNGTGLGLYMAKMILEKHINGDIEVKDTPLGACFTVTIPYKSNG